MSKEHHMEVRLQKDQPFLSIERDILHWFLKVYKASFVLTDCQMSDLSDEELKKELTEVLDALESYRDSIYTEDVESSEIARRLWDRLSKTRGGRLFLANVAMNVMSIYVNAARRSVEQPTLRLEELEAGLKRDSLLSRLDPDLADKVKRQLRDTPYFGEFVPGMYDKTKIKEDENDGSIKEKEG